VLLFQCLPVTFDFPPVSSKSFGCMSLLWYFLSLWSQRGGIFITSSIKYVLSIVLTVESRANRRKCLARLSAQNEPSLLGQTGVVGRQLGSRIEFSVATVVNEKAIDFYFLVWCLPRQCWFVVLCRFWLHCSHGLMHRCLPSSKHHHISPYHRLYMV
jgi:hypothetical protein